MKIFKYKPSEKIVINLYDASDFGYASATTVPENFIRLEIEPFEHGYENIPYNERFKWVLSHELVHIVVDDHASDAEEFTRSIFSKVPPEQTEPMSILYSLLTNYSRYTPRWHQEGIAVFMETWLSGGFGRVLGNFDEMYFRSMVYDSVEFPSYNELDSKTSQTSFLLGMLYYTYGERFCTYLSIKYGYQKLIDWFREDPGDFYEGFLVKFKKIYGLNLDEAWDDFIRNEKLFQKENISRIESAPLTPVTQLTKESIGWVTEAYYDPTDTTVIFGYHTPSHLAGIQNFKLGTRCSRKIGTLPTPSLFSVASTAYDKTTGLFLYTTKKNELYRDIWVLQPSTGETKMLFDNCRVGDITVSPATHELWGVLHSDAKVTLVYSSYPYSELKPFIGFKEGDEIYNLSVSPSGQYLAAVLHRASGSQSIVVANCDSIKSGANFKYITVTDKGSPESPSWSSDGKQLYWNAYTNGVSNIYRENLETSDIEPLSNTVRGLFKPVYINKDSLFAFQFTAEGFEPVIIPNKTADHLPAIHYLGEEVVEKDSQVVKLALKPLHPSPETVKEEKDGKDYNSLASLKILSFIPVISGFQDQKVLGLYTHIADPLIINDLTLELGISPGLTSPSMPRYHFKGKYTYKGRLVLAYDYNAPNFYDLFNERKRSFIGTRIGVGYTHYWVYDNPLKVTQKASVDYYTGVNYLNDNLVKVSQPDFGVAQTSIDSKDLRRSIGSIDFENGNEFNLTVMSFGSQVDIVRVAAQAFGAWDHYLDWAVPHNVFHFKISGGYS